MSADMFGMPKVITRPEFEGRSSIVLGDFVDDHDIGITTRGRARSLRPGAAAARLRSASVPTRPRSRKFGARTPNDGLEALDDREAMFECPIFDVAPKAHEEEPMFDSLALTKEVLKAIEKVTMSCESLFDCSLGIMTVHTNPLFEPMIGEDSHNTTKSVPLSPCGDALEASCEPSCSATASVMVVEALTLEEQFAQMKIMLENLKKDNEEKTKQIAFLTKKLEKRPESSKHNETSDDDAQSNVASFGSKKDGTDGSFTMDDVQEMISNAIKMHFCGTPQRTHRYVKPYTKRVDSLEFPFGYKPPKFQMFDGQGNPKQHVAHFVETCNNAGTEGDLLVKQFVRSLKGVAFDWYTDLAHQSIDSWEQMEVEFLNRFYNTRRVVSMVELTKTKQGKGELVVDYIDRWRALSLECKDRISEISAVEMCIRGMNLDLLYILQGIKPRSFQELATRAHDMEITIARRGGQLFRCSDSSLEMENYTKAIGDATTIVPVKFSIRRNKDYRPIEEAKPWSTEIKLEGKEQSSTDEQSSNEENTSDGEVNELRH